MPRTKATTKLSIPEPGPKLHRICFNFKEKKRRTLKETDTELERNKKICSSSGQELREQIQMQHRTAH